MILLVTSSAGAAQCAAALENELKQPVRGAANLRLATLLVRETEFTALVLDEALVVTDAEGLDTLLNNSGLATPIYVNFALSNSARVSREVRSALRRQAEAQAIAMRAAESSLRSHLRGAITGILLSTELVLSSQELSPESAEKLKEVCHLAAEIRARLEAAN